MDEIERKYVEEVRDLLSSVDLKLLELLKTESKETFMTEEIIKKETKSESPREIIFEARTYNKFKPCKYKCGGLTAWPVDYKKGDQPLHIHPTDHEILGFSEEGLDGNFHCPVVRKK